MKSEDFINNLRKKYLNDLNIMVVSTRKNMNTFKDVIDYIEVYNVVSMFAFYRLQLSITILIGHLNSDFIECFNLMEDIKKIITMEEFNIIKDLYNKYKIDLIDGEMKLIKNGK